MTTNNKSASSILYRYKCENGCGHTTIIDKCYITRRVYCGVCGTKETMVYQGECTVKNVPKSSFLTKTK